MNTVGADAPLGTRAFRYRTCTLVGPWRGSREAAATDAVRAQQAEFDQAAGIRWKVAGAIEERGPRGNRMADKHVAAFPSRLE